MDLLQAILQGVIVASTPLAFAAIGEVVAERSGVLNLGVEGMMAVSAAVGFVVTYESGSHLVGFAVAGLAGIIAEGMRAVTIPAKGARRTASTSAAAGSPNQPNSDF